MYRLALALMIGFSCAPPQPPPKDVVLSLGTSVSINNPNGSVLIEWDGPHYRRFKYLNLDWRESMIVREQLWYGVLGIYSAGGTNFRRRGDVRRIVYSEASRDFESEEALAEYMDGEWRKSTLKLVWDKSGLVGGLCTTPGRYQLNVDLWRFTVRGRIPELFAGTECSEGSILLIEGE